MGCSAMLAVLNHWIRSRAARPYIRPWGLSTPIAVLIVCLPLLRPLLHPAQLSENERQRLATVESIVKRGRLQIDDSSLDSQDHPVGAPVYARQPPMLAACLAGPYWIMDRCGLTFRSNPTLVEYLLTLLGATLPVAGAAALLYRMGRIFELSRPWRALLAASGVFGSGLVSYATVLNSQAPAAAFLLGGCAAIYHSAVTRQATRSRSWVMFAGLLLGFAAVIDLSAMVFLALMPLAVLAMRRPAAARLHAIVWYCLGALAPLGLHVWLTTHLAGAMRSSFLHANGVLAAPISSDNETAGSAPVIAANLVDGLIGAHGLLTHFPVVIFGLAGLAIVLRRNWPAVTKTMAGVSFVAMLLIVMAYSALNADWGQPMFAARWFVLFLPLLVFWAGAWLRRPHHPAMWTLAAGLLGFSVLVSLLGAAAPFAPSRPGDYTVRSAMRWLVRGTATSGYSLLSDSRNVMEFNEER
jgi:hypothetical protein